MGMQQGMNYVFPREYPVSDKNPPIDVRTKTIASRYQALYANLVPTVYFGTNRPSPCRHNEARG